MYSLDNVHKSYGNTQVLTAIDLHVATDGFVFLMGPSGSGKSTLLRLLSFVETPDEGVVRLVVHGRRFDSVGDVRPWPTVTCVFQRQFLWPHLTLRENIVLPLRAAKSSRIHERLRHVTRLFHMHDFIDRFPNQVSGGQAQRAALARALVLDPRIILIDEAHGGLDLEQQHILNDHLIRLNNSGVGLIIVTHSLEFARQYADQVIIVEKGMITEAGPKSIWVRLFCVECYLPHS